ncbi:MAG TPA: alternative ribosome rescue aminoacyl-tRNA hydrolase ArfB [Gemmatimonadaceae bacterium]|nr:alternative ribosome rescue aminoacyl-tRNA hydrolase ArfB [Gemmatimonadaceae bacterium]
MTLPALPADDGALPVNATLAIPRAELETRASRAGGPGGQHVNTSSTRVEVRWNVRRSTALSDEQRARLEERLASRLDGEGTLRVVAADSRSQRQNRERAEARLAELVRRALVVPKRRKATKPSRAAKQARLEEKRKRSRKKSERRWRGED